LSEQNDQESQNNEDMDESAKNTLESTSQSDGENLSNTNLKSSADETFSVFILKTSPQGMKGAETYLKNRKWEIATAVNMREALAYLIQKQPQFILIPSDHSSKKVRMLPKLLAQAFPVKIIGYCEGQSKGAINSLNDMGLEYTLFPPVSGPAVERIVRKILVDEERKAREQSQKALNPDGTPASGITDKDGKMVFQNSSKDGHKNDQLNLEQARAALSQLISTDGEDSHDSGVIIQKGTVAQNHQAQQNGMGMGQNNSATQEGANAQSHQANQSADKKSNTDNLFAPPMPIEEDYSSNWQSLDPKENKNEVPNFDRKKPSETKPPVFEQGLGNKGKINVKYKREGWANSPDNDSIMVQGTQQALDESVTVREDIDPYEAIEKSTNAACIIVESPQFSGYLVAAMAKDKHIDDAFLAMVRTKLFAFLKSHGEVVKDSDSMNIKVQEVEFEDWAMEQASFLRKSVHDGNEIAMAFFPSSDTNINLEQSKSEKMLKMSMNDLKADVEVEFDLYIYMPENDKYVLYTPQGGKFMSNQKDRLNAKGVTHMHLRKDSATQVKKYRAQNFLNDKIAGYKNMQSLTKPAA
jgi:hypothetical protein